MRERYRTAAWVFVIFVAGIAARSLPPPGDHDRWACALFGIPHPEECQACGVKFVRYTGQALGVLERVRKEQAQEQAKARAAADRQPPPVEAPVIQEPRPLPSPTGKPEAPEDAGE